MHDTDPLLEEKVPAGQGVHEVEFSGENVPAGQSSQVLLLMSFMKEPAGQKHDRAPNSEVSGGTHMKQYTDASKGV